MIDFRLVSAALEESKETANYYEGAERGLGQDFYDSLDATIARIRRFPEVGRTRGRRLRSLSLRRFPIDIIYYLDKETAVPCVVVIAIAHQSRHPDYWKSRIS